MVEPAKFLHVKHIINKRNGQINISVPKKELGKLDADKLKHLRFKIGWDF